MKEHPASSAPNLATELEGFCPTCPSMEEVSGQLEQLGYRLVFSLPAQPERDHLPTLPAQYHYRHASGAEVIFLAGRDSPFHTGVLILPCHESRFWLSRGGGADGTLQLTCSALALRWGCRWREAGESDVSDDEADDAQEVA